MQTIQFSGTDLIVSRLCMGAVNFGSTLNQQQVESHLNRFLELGGNFVDTAHVYNDWIPSEKSRSEKMIGQWLKNHCRKDVVLCTKGGHFDLTAPEISRVTPEQLVIDLNESLECLHTNYIDIYMLHRDNPELPVGEIMDCLDDFVRNGKVRYIACSNWTARRTAEANAYAMSHGKMPFVVNQLMWSMAVHTPGLIPSDCVAMDEEMMALGKETKLNFMAYSALARGYFTRRFLGKTVSDDLRCIYANEENERLFRQLEKLESAEAITHASLRYFVQQPVSVVPIVTFSSIDQLEECARAFL